MAKYQKCIAEIRAAAGRDLSEEDIGQILEEVLRRRKMRSAEGASRSAEDEMLEAATDFAREQVLAAAVERRNRALGAIARDRLMRMAGEADAKYGDPALALRAALVGTNKKFGESRLSVATRAQAIRDQWLGGMVSDLKRGGLWETFTSKAYERDIARELEQLTLSDHSDKSVGSGGRPGVTGNSRARDIAAVIDTYRKAALARQNRAGAWIRPLPGYIAGQSHDPATLIRAGFDAWYQAILPRLDMDKTLSRSLPDESGAAPDARTFLRSVYDALVSGVHKKARGADDNDLLNVAFPNASAGSGNLAERVSQHRLLHFRSADDWFDYNKVYGSKELTEAVLADLDLAARNTALMEALGPNPRAMVEDVRRRLQEKHRDPKKAQGLASGVIDRNLAEVEGLTRIAANPNAAELTSTILAVQSMAKLGGALLSSFGDLATKAATIRRSAGTSILDAYGKSLGSVVEALGPSEGRRAMDLLGVGIEGMVGSVGARFTGEDSVPGMFSKGLRWFFKFNGLTGWTDMNKRGLGMVLARDLGMKSEKAWGGLDAETQKLMGSYGFDATRWEIVRRAAQDIDGRRWLLPDEIRNLPDVAFRELTDGKASPRQLRGLKDELSTRLAAYILDMVEEGIPTPGARERSLINLGTRPGEALGVVLRLVMQFKAFPVTMMTKQLGRSGEGADTMAEFFKNLATGRGDIAGLAALIAGTTVLGYVSMVAKDLAKGRTPRSPVDGETWLAAMAQGGGLGIYGDFLFGEYNRFGRSVGDTLLGPTIGTAGDMVELWARLIRGDDTASAALRTFQSNMPFANLFYSKAALDYLVLYRLQEGLNPGYLRRMESRIRREQGQQFILPPSSVIGG